MNIISPYLHCGAQLVGLDELATVPVPPATDSYVPVPHAQLVQDIRATLIGAGHEIVDEKHALTKGGMRYFGTFNLRSLEESDYGKVVGFRNSHDKTFPVGLVAGSHVFICDNLAFSGDISLFRKHTVNVLRDIPLLLTDAVGKLWGFFQNQDEQYAAYKAAELTNAQVNDLVIQSLEAEVITSHHVLDVVKEWRTPRHPEFEPRTAWSLFNGYTEVLKASPSLFALDKRTRKLHNVLDKFIKFGNN